MEYFELAAGIKMPILGFGVFQIEKDICQRTVETALEIGYRLIDTAAAYFNEEEVGAAIRNCGLKREEIFVTSKLWVQDYEYEDALKGFDVSLKKLGLDYLDLYLLHKPYGNYYAAWRALEKLHKEGRIKAIGVTSFNAERLQDLILHNEIKPHLNQLETHPYFQQNANHAFLKAEGIVHQAWSPFAEGKEGIFTHPILLKIARKHGKSTAQVILRYLIQKEVAVIPKSVKPERIRENLAIFDFKLDDKDLKEIASLDTGRSPIYDDQDLNVTRFIGTHKIHD